MAETQGLLDSQVGEPVTQDEHSMGVDYNESIQPSVEQSQERPEWLLDKYNTEGRSVQDAVNEQAKAYTELQKKFGGFTGAPDAYKMDFAKDLGIQFDDGNELLQNFNEFAKTSQMSQPMYEAVLSLYAKDKMATVPNKEEEMAKLGDNAGDQLKQLSGWIADNFESDDVSTIQNLATTANNIKFLQKVMKMSNSNVVPSVRDVNAHIQPDEINEDYLQKMVGDKRFGSDPVFTQRVNKMFEEKYS